MFILKFISLHHSIFYPKFSSHGSISTKLKGPTILFAIVLRTKTEKKSRENSRAYFNKNAPPEIISPN